MDDDLRELERAVRASPRDGILSRRWLQALRRAGAVAPETPDVEPVPNPGLSRGALVLVARRSRPRPSFRWVEAMDAHVGDVLAIERVAHDGLSAILEGPPSGARSFGFGSLVPVSASP